MVWPTGTETTLRRAAGQLKRRLRRGRDEKGDAELAWWVAEGEPRLRRGELTGPNTLALSGEPTIAATYEGRRWQQARAEVHRVVREAEIDDEAFFSPARSSSTWAAGRSASPTRARRR